MSFADDLIKEASLTRTMNGAVAYSTTTDECLDFFAVAGGMRYKPMKEQIRLFEAAYIANPELAMKLLFYVRDIRGGLGERQMFRNLIRHVAGLWPESATKNVYLISEYGRWDDLLCLLGTKAEKEVARVINEQLTKDMEAFNARKNGDVNAPISLLAKWLPTDNTSSKESRKLAKRLAKLLGISRKAYRKTLVALRSQICITEKYLTSRKYRKVNYQAVPGAAMFKYRKAFRLHDEERFKKYLNKAIKGKSVIHSSTVDPYVILRPYFNDAYSECDGVLEAMWKSLPGQMANENAVCVVDTSGSMYWGYKGLVPALISQALGIYCAERCKGIFHNKVITFESEPHVFELKGDNLRDKLHYLQSAPWGGSTNMEGVFDLILNTAIRNKAKQKDLPSLIYIISDMEFNYAIDDPDETVYECARRKFEEKGYKFPAVVFHNVNSWQMQTPVSARTKGAALVSGSGIASCNQKFDGNMTPLSHMLDVLTGKRYEPVHA